MGEQTSLEFDLVGHRSLVGLFIMYKSHGAKG